MITPQKLLEAARACRAFAVKLDKDADRLKDTTVHPAAVKEARSFRDLATELEEFARLTPVASAAPPSNPPAPKTSGLRLVSPAPKDPSP